MVAADRRIYGLTGEIGRDGVLTQELQFTLNGIQERAARTSLDYLANRPKSLDISKKRSPLIAMATGIGKGKIIHLVLESQFRSKPDSKVLVVAGTKNVLVDQTHESLRGYQQSSEIRFNGDGPQVIVFNQLNDGYIQAEDSDELNDATTDVEGNEILSDKSFLYTTGKLGTNRVSVEVATIQSVQSGLERGRINPEEYDLVIVDEVHNIGTAKRKAAIDQFDRVIGFTATPHRHSGRMKFPDQYGFEVIESLPLPEAQELRLLPPLLGLQINTQDIIPQIPTSRTGQIDFKALEKILKDSPDLRPYIADRIASMISSGDKKYKTVVAVNFVWEAHELAELLAEKGIKVGVAVNKPAAQMIHSDKIPAIDSIERYKLPESNEKSIQVLLSPNVASEGFDAPFTEILVWASPTDSNLRYTQYTGRLARRSEGKLYGVIVDCLYQTSQYSWSYNMGMWMKGSVRQLENGLLYLGPEQDIATLRDLPDVQQFRAKADKHGLVDIQKGLILEVQPGDLVLSKNGLTEVFEGSETRLRRISGKVIKNLQESDEDIVVERHSGGKKVLAILNRQVFIDAMVKEGVVLRPKEIEPVKESDFALTLNNIKENFAFSSKAATRLVNETLKEFKEKYPHMIVSRKSGHITINVITDRSFALQFFEEKGILPRTDFQGFRENDFPITRPSLISTFRGQYPRIVSIVEDVVNSLVSENIDFVVYRLNGTNRKIRVVTNKQRFITEMLARGVQLKDYSQP